MAEGTTGALILDVSLDIGASADPHVIISNRNATATAGQKIKWKQASGALNFTFSDFQPQTSPFDSVDIAANKIECDFNSPPGDPAGTEYDYTITVLYDGESYDSDIADVTRPSEGRAVIRN